MASDAGLTLWLVRHGETEWSKSGQHTGRTDIPLTDKGMQEADAIGWVLKSKTFNLVLVSPLGRARVTAERAGFTSYEIEPNLREWDYGDYEGRSTADVRKEREGWGLWKDGVPNGETVEQVGARADLVIQRAEQSGGNVLLFGHGHILRILIARWLGLPPLEGKDFLLETATLSTLTHERETRVIGGLNRRC
ncbi:MAG: histidine phosphatase family protein [Acidobacteriaceae bacterium]